MSDDFDDLSARLEALADAPAPPSTFDPRRAATSGRRRLLAFRTSAIGGGGTLAVAATLGIVTAFAPGPPLPATPTSGIAADPLASYADYGWLPPSLPNVNYAATVEAAGYDVFAEGVKTADGAPRVDLQLLSGDGPGTPNAAERMIPTNLNDGRRAYWVTQSVPNNQFAGDFQLRFPAKDGRWVALSWSVNWSNDNSYKIAGVPPTPTASGPTARPSVGSPAPTSVPVSAAWQQTLLHIATDVTDTPTQIPLPFQLKGLPANFLPARAFLLHPAGFDGGAPGTWSVTLMFFSGDLTGSIDVGLHGTLPGETYPSTECTTSMGLDACVQYSGSSSAFDAIGGAKGLLRHVVLLGPDEKNWTKDVIVP